ncbi:hypothetical protein GE21DRAFT_8218 [Neurospora crassa]|uniref:Uncharacterized protein n=1 Tax=Neurospora crassa (strain ATCC 24698 / 74-OR23-1A / CBS 708.71 / DSM 1257 / FGSC 987) TaxID=367110 RepID=Q7S7H1_NEUCR|nr:hypothetical protein NCU04226 [Neurospora crassa OR74A]EAA31614.2 hypothetical protein NCU04226 [Neurospora crassa OR74A]KHE86075.1 hypothetical protein GE21DRAFT_8218 [Neurospora crassa]|eukprot:XP_960850.2 hypothetical protein NCU04226 [Neurospora crassa OR74A]
MAWHGAGVCTSDIDVKLEKARCRTPCDVETSIPHLILSQFQGRNARHIQHPTASGALLVIDKWAESNLKTTPGTWSDRNLHVSVVDTVDSTATDCNHVSGQVRPSQ